MEKIAERNRTKRIFTEVISNWKRKVQANLLEKQKKAINQQFSEETSELTVKFNKENELLVRKLQETQKTLDEINISKEEMQENLKRAFMRGVCALNFEAMSILQEKKGENKESPNKNNNLIAKTNGLTQKILDINDNLNGFLSNNQNTLVKEKQEVEEKEGNELCENSSEGEENEKENDEKNKNLAKKIVFYQAPKVNFIFFIKFIYIIFYFIYFILDFF